MIESVIFHEFEVTKQISKSCYLRLRDSIIFDFGTFTSMTIQHHNILRIDFFALIFVYLFNVTENYY